MKRNALILVLSLFLVSVFAQEADQKVYFNYQAVARDQDGNEMSNTLLDIKFAILKGSETGEVVYEEEHLSERTSAYGVFNIEVGHGDVILSTVKKLQDIPWYDSVYFFNVQIDIGSGYIDMGTARFNYLPYSVYSLYTIHPAGIIVIDNDTTNEIQQLSFAEDSMYLHLSKGGGAVDLSPLFDSRDNDPTNEIQHLSISGNDLSIILNDQVINTVHINTNDADANPTNEIQDLQLNGDTLKITDNGDANPIMLTKYLDNTDNQNLKIENDSIKIDRGQGVDMASYINPESYYFHVSKTTSTNTGALVTYFLIYNEINANVGNAFNTANSTFIAPADGLYSFYVTFDAQTTQDLSVYVNNSQYDKFLSSSSLQTFRLSFMLFLRHGDTVNIVAYSGTQTTVGHSVWCGFKVY